MYSAVAVTAYFSSKQLLLFAFLKQHYCMMYLHYVYGGEPLGQEHGDFKNFASIIIIVVHIMEIDNTRILDFAKVPK